ncbi:NfeD family protein [Lunatibacter salilacus]|uniref:NfeD family protein n=1 Tax=Lunatibacter salilacus TaxID=2483804 RepID=UPI00131DE803|nr:NfeD family protein [Lunatibacter salilacus]
MTIFIISSLIIFGSLLVMVEILFVPGTTIIGLIGVIFSGIGVYYGYQEFPASTATIIFVVTVLINLGMLIYGFKAGVWKKFSLTDTNTGRSFDGRLLGLEIGQKGRTTSDCKPFGKAEFGDIIYEVKSDNGFISTNEDVYIQKLENNKIIIKQ